MLPLVGPPTVTTVAMTSASTMVTNGTTIASSHVVAQRRA